MPANRVEPWCHQVATKVLEPLGSLEDSGRTPESAPSRTRVSGRFARAVVSRTLEGETLYRDAFQLLGVSRAEVLTELGRNSG